MSSDEGETPTGRDDETTKLPHWREPATGEIPRVVADLVGDDHARWSDAHVGDLTEDDTEVGAPSATDDVDETLRLDLPFGPNEQEPRPAEPRRPTVKFPASSDYPSSREYGESRRTTFLPPVREERRNRDQEKPVASSGSVHDQPRAPHPGDDNGTPPGAVSHGNGPTRSKLVSTVTGIVLALVLLGALYLGVLSTEIVVALGLLVAASEAYGMFRHGGAKPASLVGLIAVVGACLGAYFDGLPAVVGVVAAAVIISSAWYLFHVIHAPAVPGTTSTMFVVIWVGVLGSYASVIIRRADFGVDGLGLLIGVVGTAAVADTFAYFGGSLFGSHKLAPRVSPTKSIEGFLAGAVASILVGALLLPHLHPFTVESGTLVGAISAFLTPLGDLVESALKREVHVKDSSRLLPGHGGMLDRIDGILFVLPAAYYLFLLLHIH